MNLTDKMHCSFIGILLGLFILGGPHTKVLAQALSVAQTPRILWLVTDAGQPHDFRDLGHFDIPTDTNNLLLDKLSQYQFDFQTVPNARVERLMDANSHICVTNRLKKPERVIKQNFSQPLNLYLGLRLYSVGTKNQVPKGLLDKQGKLRSLPALFEHFNRQKMVISKGRSYGAGLDQQLEQIPSTHLIVRSGHQPILSMVKMLTRDRVSFLLEFPVELKASFQSIEKPQLLNAYQLADSEPYFVGHVACNRNPFMETFMLDVNKALTSLYQQRAFYLAHIRYMDEADIGQFEPLFKQVFALE